MLKENDLASDRHIPLALPSEPCPLPAYCFTMMTTGPFARQFGFWFVLATGRPSRTGASAETEVRVICFPSTREASMSFYCARQWSLLLSVFLHYPYFPSPTATLPLPPCYFRQLVPAALPWLDSGWFLPPVVLPCLFSPPGILGGHRWSVSSHPYACGTNTLPYFISQHAAKNFFIRLNIYRRRDVQ